MIRTGVILVIASLIFSACTLYSKEIVEDPSREPNLRLIFEDDFSGDEIGTAPSKWTVANSDGVIGRIEVISEPEMTSGKAVKVKVNKHPGTEAGNKINVSMRGPAFGEPAKDIDILIMEHSIRHVAGSDMYAYVLQSGSNALLWYVSSGDLVYNAGGGLTDRATMIEGWNRVKIVADHKENEVLIYVNDMDSPAIGPHPLHQSSKVDEIEEYWATTYLTFSHWTNPNNEREMHYGDFKVWGVEPTQ